SAGMATHTTGVMAPSSRPACSRSAGGIGRRNRTADRHERGAKQRNDIWGLVPRHQRRPKVAHATKLEGAVSWRGMRLLAKALVGADNAWVHPRHNCEGQPSVVANFRK